MTAREALSEAERRLGAAGIDTPRVDAELLVAHALGVSRTGVYADLDAEVDGLEPLLARRERREPLAYVLGEWGFRRLTLKTDARALVPRPETETVVERALALLAGSAAPRVLDVGVGSGAIALALKDERPDAHVTGVDVSARCARARARERASGSASRSSCARAASRPRRRAGISSSRTRRTSRRSRGSSPSSATSRGRPSSAPGFHEQLARVARTRFLVLEVGDGQAADVAATLEAAGYRDVRTTQDLAGRERVVEGAR